VECYGDNSAGSKVIISKKDDGKEITVNVGNIIHIELEQYSGTGYTWVLEKSCEDFLELIGEDTKAISRPGFVGTPVQKIWKLKAVKGGETEINLYLYRPWEGKDKAVDKFKVRIKIF
jgi:predicted secreted protein